MPARKIGFIFDDSLDKPDGVQQYVLTMGAWLAQQGHDVHYLTGQTTRVDIPNMHSLSRNLNVRFNGNGMAIPLPTSRRRLKALLEREKFDILHIQAPFSPWLGARLINLAPAGTICVGTFHILPQSKAVTLASRVLALWTRRARHRLDQLLSVSTAAQDFALRIFGQQSMVLPNVIDYDRFHEAVPNPKSDDAIRLLYLGRLVPRKGCQQILAALAELNKDSTLPAYRLTICGKGPLLPSLQAYVKQHDMSDMVTFAGFVSETDKPSIYASADIAIFPSTGGESFGIVLLEAMASGKAAVLAANNPGYSSVITRSDMTFRVFDSSDLARVLRSYLTDPTKRAEVAAWGETYAASFDTAKVGQQLVTVYERLSAQKNVP